MCKIRKPIFGITIPFSAWFHFNKKHSSKTQPNPKNTLRTIPIIFLLPKMRSNNSSISDDF